MKSQESLKDFSEALEKAKAVLAEKKLDLSSDEDLSLAVMNLISIEEHLFFTAEKTKKPEYFDFINEVREIRKVTMKQLIPEYEGEVWCVSKHLFASSMRLMEVGTKRLHDGKKDEAKQLFDQAYTLYSLFWGIRLRMLGVTERGAKKDDGSVQGGGIASGVVPAVLEKAEDETKQVAVKEFVAKLVDCCGE